MDRRKFLNRVMGTTAGTAAGIGLSKPGLNLAGRKSNTRGLVELVLLNVGLDIGILTPALFSMMVCMAVVTTCMATPLMDWGGAKVQVAHAGYRAPERLGIDSGP
jgi:Kef-type K+ transport system membrane component KefB